MVEQRVLEGRNSEEVLYEKEDIFTASIHTLLEI